VTQSLSRQICSPLAGPQLGSSGAYARGGTSQGRPNWKLIASCRGTAVRKPKEKSVMARVIEFYTPANFPMKVTSVPATQSAKVIEFYQPVRKSAWGAACLDGLARPWCGPARQLSGIAPDEQWRMTSKCGRGYQPVDTLTVRILCCWLHNVGNHRVSAKQCLETCMQSFPAT